MGKKQQNKANAAKGSKPKPKTVPKPQAADAAASEATPAEPQPPADAKPEGGAAAEAEATPAEPKPPAEAEPAKDKPKAKGPRYRARWTIGMDRRTYAPGETITGIPEGQAKRLLAAGCIEPIPSDE